MLRQIISVSLASLAITACASLIPIKANAATLTATSVGTLVKNPGDSITFILTFTPTPLDPSVTRISALSYSYDDSELSLTQQLIDNLGIPINGTSIIVRLTLDVLRPVKDERSDFFNITAFYQVGLVSETVTASEVLDVVPPQESVPEPLTMLGAATALGYGAILKRQSFKNKKS
jgi:hypothetical protein